MAEHFYGVSRNEDVTDVVAGNSSPAKDVEVVINLSAGMDKGEVIDALDALSHEISTGSWPPYVFEG